MTAEEAQKALQGFRDEIDALDARILALLNERAAVAEKIGDTKAAASLPVVELARERAVVERMMERNGGPLSAQAVERIYQTIMLEMRRIQEMRRR
jgi:chorismate mutase-like protein